MCISKWLVRKWGVRSFGKNETMMHVIDWACSSWRFTWLCVHICENVNYKLYRKFNYSPINAYVSIYTNFHKIRKYFYRKSKINSIDWNYCAECDRIDRLLCALVKLVFIANSIFVELELMSSHSPMQRWNHNAVPCD